MSRRSSKAYIEWDNLRLTLGEVPEGMMDRFSDNYREDRAGGRSLGVWKEVFGGRMSNWAQVARMKSRSPF